MKTRLHKKLTVILSLALIFATFFNSMESISATKKAKTKVQLSVKSVTFHELGDAKKVTIRGVKKAKIKKLIVASANPDVAEFVKNGKTGFTVYAIDYATTRIRVTLILKKAVNKKKKYEWILPVKIVDYVAPDPDDTPTATCTPATKPTCTPIPTKAPTPVPTKAPTPTPIKTPKPTQKPVQTPVPTPGITYVDCPYCVGGIVFCSTCGGVGTHECGHCIAGYIYNGTSRKLCTYCHGVYHVPCDTCKGNGRWKCTACGGQGRIPATTY